MSDALTLKEKREFSRAYKRGRSFVSPLLVTYVIKNNSNNLRYGITTGKKIGKAVQRNRARRVIRAAFYMLEGNLKQGYDCLCCQRQNSLCKKHGSFKLYAKSFENCGIDY